DAPVATALERVAREETGERAVRGRESLRYARRDITAEPWMHELDERRRRPASLGVEPERMGPAGGRTLVVERMVCDLELVEVAPQIDAGPRPRGRQRGARDELDLAQAPRAPPRRELAGDHGQHARPDPVAL